MYEIFEELLKKHNVTTYQVAKATGITTSSFTGWKQGKWNFKHDKLQKIADYFGVSLNYLVSGKEVDIETKHLDGVVPGKLQRMSDQQKLIMKYAEKLAELNFDPNILKALIDAEEKRNK